MERVYYIKDGKDDVFHLVSQHYKKKVKTQENIYEVDLRNLHCKNITKNEVCPGYWYKHNCIHLTTIIELLRYGKVAVFHHKKGKAYYTTWDFKDLKKEDDVDEEDKDNKKRQSRLPKKQ